MASHLAWRMRLALVAAAIWSFAGEAAMAGDQPFTETLVVRIVQMGFAGETGTEYRVEPTGEWQARRFVNERTTEELGAGSLSSGAMIELSHQVRAARLEEAQAAETAGDQVNAAYVELRLGDDRAVAALASGATLDEECAAAEGSSQCAFLDLARSVEAKLQE